MLQNIPLNKLELSPKNVRKTGSETDIEALAASIEAVGLRQNLNVETGPKGRYLVTAGGRRWRALKALVKAKKIKANAPIPCKVSEGGEDAAEISLTENVQRVAMHPADQFEAFAALVEDGKTVEQVAQRFGCGVKLVKQRLKLGRLSPRVLEAFRAGKLDLDAAAAFTVADDHNDQERVFDHLQSSPSHAYDLSAHRIKHLLTEGALPGSHKLVAFIGLEAYREAGGAVREDLFGDEVFIEDRTLAEQLAVNKLESAAAELKAEGWKWAEIGLDGAASGCVWGQVSPVEKKLPPKLAAEMKGLQARLKALEEEDDGTPEAAEEWDRTEARIDAIEAEQLDYRPEDKARAGCLVMIDRTGELWIEKGLVRPEDEKGPAEPDAAGEEQEAGKPDKKAPKGYSRVLVDDLAAYRLQIAQAYLAKRFDVAFDLIAFTMVRSVLRHEQPESLSASFHQTHERVESSLKDTGDTVAADLLREAEKGLSQSWLLLEPEKQFKAFCRLPNDDKAALFAYCTAQMLQAQLSTEPGASALFEQVGSILGVDVAAHWRPSSEAFWSRITKGQIIDVAGSCLGRKHATAYEREKKGALAHAMGRHFTQPEGGTGLNKTQAAKVKAWLPEGMAFAKK